MGYLYFYISYLVCHVSTEQKVVRVNKNPHLACRHAYVQSWIEILRNDAKVFRGAPSRSLMCTIDTHTPPFNGPFSSTTRVGRYQKGKINLDFTEARDSEWQWHQLSFKQVCISLQTDNHVSTSPLSAPNSD